jgi:hypothetical protein
MVKHRSLILGLVIAALASLFVSTAALADSFTSTLSDPGTPTLTPNGCSGLGCTYTFTGTHTSTPGQGTYTMKDVLSAAPYNAGPNKWCLKLGSGSNARLDFSASYLTLAPDSAPFCGPLVTMTAAGTTYSFSGPYTLTGSGPAYQGATGSGTLTLNVTVDWSSELHNSSIVLGGTLVVPTTGGVGGGSGGGGVGVGATPELGSLLLFGSGGLGLAGYALNRVRARRKLPSR